MTLPQRFGNRLTTALLRGRFGVRQRDLGPFRALRLEALRAIDMRDRTWGWTVEMQIKALQRGLRVAEVPVRWHPRAAGESKISGRLIGVMRAASKILWTFARHAAQGAARRRRGHDEVVLFVKHPQPGRVKTRLAETVGAGPAARLYRHLAVHCQQALLDLQSANLAELTVFTSGAPATRFRRWMPGAARYCPQPEGDLGTRLEQAFESAFGRGAERVAVVGSDCPGIDAETVGAAFGALREVDVAIVPADDGGYALLALKAARRELFRQIPWSGPQVLERTRQRAAALGLSVRELPSLADVDIAQDLEHVPPVLSVIIPVLNEADNLERLLPELTRQIRQCPEPIEIFVADGHSSDGSAACAARHGATVVVAERERGRQMNAAAGLARGDWLWFLHADSGLSPDTVSAVIASIWRDPAADWGWFPARLDAAGLRYRLNERLINLRSRWLRLPYGDQGLLVRRRLFEHGGGYEALPRFEDLQLVRTLGRHGRPLVVPLPIDVNVRRWRRDGFWRTAWHNSSVLIQHLVLGRDCETLARRYNPTAGPAAREGRTQARPSPGRRDEHHEANGTAVEHDSREGSAIAGNRESAPSTPCPSSRAHHGRVND